MWLTCPVVIHAERDEAKHRNVEADVPARVGSLYGIEVLQTRDYIPKPIPTIPFIQKKAQQR